MNRSITLGLLFSAAITLAGCTESTPSKPTAENAAQPAPATAAVMRSHDFVTVTRGGKLFHQHCAACHGDAAQGQPTWQRPDPDGRYPAPPLNGTGHAWHHPTAALKQTIKRGTLSLGGSMPAWGEKLSDAEIDAIIAWFQSKWPDEIYAAWARMDAQSGK